MIRIIMMMLPLWLYGGALHFSVSSEVVANAQTILFEVDTSQINSKIQKPYVLFLDKKYPLYPHPAKVKDSYYALVPVAYGAKPQEAEALIVTPSKEENRSNAFPIMIVDANYSCETLCVAPSRAVRAKMDTKRIKKEVHKATQVYRKIRAKSSIHESFAYPMENKITSAFGNKRVFNGVLKSFHSGTDFRACTGTPIVASNDGIVVIAKKRYFAGNSVVIDHGRGVFTQYYHLSKIKVKRGQRVKKGQLLGLAGATGRVTGPHLHFGVKVQGVTVDPMQFLDVINSLYALK